MGSLGMVFVVANIHSVIKSLLSGLRGIDFAHSKWKRPTNANNTFLGNEIQHATEPTDTEAPLALSPVVDCLSDGNYVVPT